MTAQTNKTPLGKGTQIVHFWTTGKDMTRQIRDFWVEGRPKSAIEICTGMKMTMEQAIELCTGKKQLEGSTREGDGTLAFVPDSQTEHCRMPISVEDIIKGLEREFITASEHVTIYKESERGIWDDDSETEEDYCLKRIAAYEKDRDEVIEQLEAAYPAAGKSLKDLPYSRIRSYRQIKLGYKQDETENHIPKDLAELEQRELEFRQKYIAGGIVNPDNLDSISDIEDWARSRVDFIKKDLIRKGVTRCDKPTGKLVLSQPPVANYSNRGSAMLDKALNALHESKATEKLSREEKIQMRHSDAMLGGAYYLRHCPVEQCKSEKLQSGFLTPEGIFYGAEASPYVHRAIVDGLNDLGVISGMDEDMCQDGGWLKLSGTQWTCRSHFGNQRITDKQVEFIIDYETTLNEHDIVNIDGMKIKLTVLATLLDGAKYDLWEMNKASKA